MDTKPNNIYRNLTLTDYVNLEAARKNIEPGELWKSISTEDIDITQVRFPVSTLRTRLEALEDLGREAQRYDAVVNVREMPTTCFFGLATYYIITALGVNLQETD